MNWKKMLPNLLMAAGAFALLGVGFSLGAPQKWFVFGGIVAIGVGWFWDKLVEG